MNSQTNRFFLTFIFLCVTFSIKSKNIDGTLWQKADSLFNAHKYMASLVEYERIVFQSPNPEIKQQAIFQKAMIYKAMGRFEKTEAELDRIGVRTPNDTLFSLKAYELALAQYMTGHYQEALNTIENYSLMLPDTHKVLPDLLTLKVLCLNHLFEFEKAKSTINKLVNISNQNQASHYGDILECYKEVPKYRNPEKARHLSLLPGLGQAYCGEIFEGGISFLLNASALGFGVWQVYSEYYFTGYVVGVTLLQKFHSGGQHRAELLAIQSNKENTLKFNQKIVNIFLKP